MPEHCQVHAYHDRQIEHLTDKIDAFEFKLNGLDVTVAKMEAHYEETERLITSMNGTQEKILQAIANLKAKPGKRWEQLVTGILSTLITAGVTALVVYLAR